MSDRTTSQALKFMAKIAVAHALYAVGLLQLWSRLKLRGAAVVLTYHRVLPTASLQETWSHPGMVVSRATFERHLKALRKHFSVVTLAEFAEHLGARRPFTRPACLITFDDGWLDTYSEAWPALRRYRLPAVVFVPVDVIESNGTFWREELGSLIFEGWRASSADPALRDRCDAVLRRHELEALLEWREPAAARAAIRSVVHGLDAVVDAGRGQALIAELRALVGDRLDRTCDSVMTWRQAREMAADGVTFGAHGATHRPLTTLPAAEVDRELERSVTKVQECCGGGVAALSYPNGEHNGSVLERVRKAGIGLSFSTRPGIVFVGDDPLRLPRINVHEAASTAPLLMARIVGMF